MVSSKSDGSIILSTKVDTTGIDKGMNTMKSGVSSLAKGFGKLAAAIGLVFSVKTIINFGKTSSQVATQTEASVSRLIDIYGKASEAVGEFIDKNAIALGMSKSDAATFSSVYGNLFSVWADQQTNADLTMQYLNMTAVVASKTGRTMEDVQERIRSGLLGNTEAIEDLGVFVNVKTIEMTESFKSVADGRNWEQLTAYEQSQVRTLAILEQSTKKYGTQVAETSALAKSRFNTVLQDLSNTVGILINKILIPAMEYATKLFTIVNSVLQQMFGISSQIINNIESTDSQSQSIENSVENQNALTEAVEETADAQEKALAGFDNINILSKQNVSSIAGTDGTSALPGEYEIIQNYSKDNSSIVSKKLQELRDTLSGLQDIDLTNVSKSLDLLSKPLEKLGNILWDVLLWGIKNVITPLATFTIEDVLPRFFETLSIVLEILATIIGKYFDLYKQFYDEFLKPIAEYAAPKFLGLWDKLNTKLNEFSQILEESEAWDDLQIILGFIYDKLRPIVENLIDFVFWIGEFSLNNYWIDLKYLFYDLEDVLGLISALIEGDFDDAWKHLQELLIDNRIDKSKEKFDNLKNSIGQLITKLKATFDEWGKEISEWWDEKVAPWFTVEKWNEVLQGMVDGFAETWNKVYDFFDVKLPEWWDKNIAPWFTKEKWKTLFEGAVDGVKKGWKDFLSFFTTAIPNWWEEDVTPWFSIKKWKELGNNLKKGICNPIIEAINWLIDKVNKFSIDIPEIKGVTKGFTFGIDIAKIPKLAQGAVIPPNSEFLAVLGDQKQGNNIEAPEDLIRKIVREETGNQNFTIRATGSMAQLIRMLNLEIKKEDTRATIWR